MTKTVHPVLKKTGAVLLAVLVFVLMAVPAFAVTLPDAPTGYVYDGANVLSSSTESYIERTGSALAEACGAEVVVATVDFTDGEDIADYAYDLFNKWGIGDKKENNGLLILLSIGEEDYYAEPGAGLTDVFTGGVLDAMLYDYLEDDFAAKDYDSGVKKVYARAVEILENYYNVSYSTGTTNNANTNYNYTNNNTSGGVVYGFQRFFSRVGRFIFIVLFVIVVIALSVLRPRRRYYRRGWGAPPPPPPMGGGFWRGPRPPRGPGGPGFGGPGPGGPRPGGFGGGFSGSSRPSGGSRPGGGRSGSFGSGRSGGGAPRSGGGSTHGGGAGRRR